jgi:hypothetical protein
VFSTVYSSDVDDEVYVNVDAHAYSRLVSYDVKNGLEIIWFDQSISLVKFFFVAKIHWKGSCHIQQGEIRILQSRLEEALVSEITFYNWSKNSK